MVTIFIYIFIANASLSSVSHQSGLLYDFVMLSKHTCIKPERETERERERVWPQLVWNILIDDSEVSS